MLFTRSFLLLTTFTCFALNASVKAVPIYQSKVYAPEAGFLLTESLSEYYENIVDQVMMDVSEDVLSYLPEKISRGDVQCMSFYHKSVIILLSFYFYSTSPSSKVDGAQR